MNKIKVKEKYNIHNLGCKKTNLSALNWFFKNEEFGIILHVDILCCMKNRLLRRADGGQIFQQPQTA